MVQAGVMDV